MSSICSLSWAQTTQKLKGRRSGRGWGPSLTSPGMNLILIRNHRPPKKWEIDFAAVGIDGGSWSFSFFGCTGEWQILHQQPPPRSFAAAGEAPAHNNFYIQSAVINVICHRVKQKNRPNAGCHRKSIDTLAWVLLVKFSHFRHKCIPLAGQDALADIQIAEQRQKRLCSWLTIFCPLKGHSCY